MEASRRPNTTEYVIGNTVRKINSEPSPKDIIPARRKPLSEEEFRELKRRERAASSKKVQTRTSAQVNGIDFVSLLILSGAIIITLYVCVSYLMVQSQITSMSKQTAQLESQLVKLQNDNNTTLERINTSVNLTHIYKVATKELGMVHADKDHIITYEEAKSDYARKYGEIPEVKNSSLLDKILDK